MYLNVDESGRIVLATMKPEWANFGFIESEPPEEMTCSEALNYKIVDGEWIYDPLPEPEPILTLEEVDSKAMEAQTVATEAKTTANESIQAIGELGVLTTTNMSENGQALGELGVLVAELKTSNEELIKQNEELKSQISDLKLKVENLRVNSALTF